MRRRLLRAAVVMPALAACAYYNGLYNAKEVERAADRLTRDGRDAEALGQYADMAARAETVLVRYPRSRWRAEALYLAGRGHAMSGRCGVGVARLDEFLAAGPAVAALADRARLARAICDVRDGRAAVARAELEALATSRVDGVGPLASLWAARAAMAVGDTRAAERHLAAVGPGAADWELVAASLGARDYPRAESLLVRRAGQGDVRPELGAALVELWRAGRSASVDRLVERYDAARTRLADRVALRLAAADLHARAGGDSAARVHLLRARRVALDTLQQQEAAARLALLDLSRVATLPEADSVLARLARDARSSPLRAPIEAQALVLRLLVVRPDPSGAARFLAAEIARDSLRAPALAHHILMQIAGEVRPLALAPKALLAASLLRPDSAASYAALVRRRFGTSPYALLLDGGDPAGRADYQEAEELLRRGWTVAVALADSLRQAAAATAVPGGIPTIPPPA